MLEPNRPIPSSGNRPLLPVVHAAKWPPDDDGPGGGVPAGGGMPTGGGGGGFDAGDGNFKKGATKPIAILIGILAVGGLAAFLVLGAKQEAEKIPVEKAATIKKDLLMRPMAEQMPEWRKYATAESPYLKQEALKHLAWAKDPEGVAIATKALSDLEQNVRAQAAVALAEYGSPAADSAKPALVKAFTEATAESKPQIAWTLVELGEKSAQKGVLDEYRAGHLSQVRKLDGALAFDPNKLVSLVGVDELANMAGDPSPAVRQLVATVLSRHAEAKYTDALIKLLGDEDAEISRQAAPGLGKIGDARSRAPLLEKLKGADNDSRTKYLEALRDGVGTEGLVVSIDSIPTEDRAKEWHRIDQVFGMIRKLADPRGGDSLLAYIGKHPHIHWETFAAFAMAEIGDVRAVPSLAKRLRMDENKIYGDDTDYEMMVKRNNNERVVAARMIADLAVMYPEKRAQIRNDAEDAIIFWIHELPSPHANGMRALAAMESTKDLPALRKWANPDKPLPLEGQQPPMPEEWVVAQSALRYVGWMKDESSWNVLDKSFRRRDPKLDVTMDGLMHGGLAILGMTLRAIGYGAAQGMSEWGDHKAVKTLMDYIDEPKENEQSRNEACSALAWVANADDMVTVAQKIQKYGSGDPKDEFRRSCYLETLITRPIPGTATALLELLKPSSSMTTRHQAARAIGKAGFDSTVEAKLLEMMKDEQLMVDATLALILGGTADTAARAIAMWVDKPKEALDELQELWYKSFGYWSTEDLEKGHIFRFVDNAEAIGKVELKDTPQGWAPVQLEKQFNTLDFDNGPHSFTRVVLRHRLLDMAKGDDATKKAAAIRTLRFMKEQGVLLSLRDAPGDTGKLASEAYHELMNPKVVTGVKTFDEEKTANP
ncbi:MAG TPA: HEAT repeat domain-containing protein [Polyangiaceae bacterium]|nr:HEAT repeat domain-containing protein [Polyangiaceae bacterium]